MYKNLISLENYGLEDLKKLIGRKIVDVGFYPDIEGGLTLEYQDEGDIKRIILGFTELGMWVHWHGIKGLLNQDNILANKIEQFHEFVFDINKESSFNNIDINKTGGDIYILSFKDQIVEIPILSEKIRVMFEEKNKDYLLMKLFTWADYNSIKKGE